MHSKHKSFRWGLTGESRIMNYRSLEKAITAMKSGERCYINAINLSFNAIEVLSKYIKDGVLKPDKEELKKYIVPEATKDYMSGKFIAPQMSYVKQ